MSSNTNTGENKTPLVTILASDGTFRIEVPSGTPNSEIRTWELKDGTKGEKNELVFDTLTGNITDVSIIKGKFGKLIQVDVQNVTGKTVTLSTSTEMPFGEDVMKKLPNLDLTKPVTLKPYAFKGKQDRMVRGITVTQDGKKIENHFFDSEKKVAINGAPEAVKESDGTVDWKFHFTVLNKFLVDYTTKHFPTKKVIETKNEDIDVSAFFGEEANVADVNI